MQQDFSLPADRKKMCPSSTRRHNEMLKIHREKLCRQWCAKNKKKKKKMNKKRNQRRKEWQEALFCHYAWASQRMAFFFLFVILFNTKYAFFLLIMLKGSSNRSSNITQEIACHTPNNKTLLSCSVEETVATILVTFNSIWRGSRTQHGAHDIQLHNVGNRIIPIIDNRFPIIELRRLAVRGKATSYINTHQKRFIRCSIKFILANLQSLEGTTISCPKH